MVQEVQVTTAAPEQSELKQHKIWHQGHMPQPCAVVIFGATGDLTQRMLLPMLAHLWHDHPLPQPFVIVGFARREMTLEQWRAMALQSVNTYMKPDDKMDEKAQQEFAHCLFYCQANFDDPAGYQKLSSMLEDLDKTRNTEGNRLFYMATPPELDMEVIHHLGESGLSRPVHPVNNHHATIITTKAPGRASSSKNPLDTIWPAHKSSIALLLAPSVRSKSIVSIITWARRRCRTSWHFASPTACSSQSGT